MIKTDHQCMWFCFQKSPKITDLGIQLVGFSQKCRAVPICGLKQVKNGPKLTKNGHLSPIKISQNESQSQSKRSELIRFTAKKYALLTIHIPASYVCPCHGRSRKPWLSTQELDLC